MTYQRARGRHVQSVLYPFVQFTRAEAFKIRTLATIYISDLDVVARFYKKGLSSL